ERILPVLHHIEIEVGRVAIGTDPRSIGSGVLPEPDIVDIVRGIELSDLARPVETESCTFAFVVRNNSLDGDILYREEPRAFIVTSGEGEIILHADTGLKERQPGIFLRRCIQQLRLRSIRKWQAEILHGSVEFGTP